MVLVMEDVNKHPVNTLEEVKKLQDLVRKLELQNQQLRNKQNKLSRKTSHSISKEGSKLSSASNFTKITNYDADEDCQANVSNCNDSNEDLTQTEIESKNLNYLDEIEIIKVSDVDISDDESWLYTSPKGLTPEQKSESPYKWLRKDLDDPNNKELQLAKRALVAKLNEFDILSTPSHRNFQRLSGNRVMGGLRKPVVPCKISYSAHEQVQYSVIDTRTFTKSKKRQAMEYLTSPPMSNNFNEEFERNELCRRGSDVSLDSSTGTYTLADANDVQEVARMQEESLRLSSPVGTPKRQSGPNSIPIRKLSASSRSSVSDMDNTENNDIPSLNSCVNEDNHEISNNPIVPGRLNFSDHSSPSESPYGSNGSLDNVPPTKKVNPTRRSMPNLNRARAVPMPTTRAPLTNSEKNKQRSFASKTGASGRRSDSNLLASAKSRKVASPTREKFKNVSHYISPTSSSSSVPVTRSRPAVPRAAANKVSRLPAKSGLPRPSRATSASRTSGIPMPSAIGKKHATEDCWSDGCF